MKNFRQPEKAFDGRKFDYVCHLAAEYDRWNGKDHYGNLWDTNAIGTKHMLRLQEKVDDHVYAAREFYGFFGDHTAFDVEDDK